MSFDKEMFSSLFVDEDRRKFLLDRESQLEYSISVISSLCSELSSSSANNPQKRRESINGILKHCCRMLKVSRLYSCFSKVLSDEELTMQPIDAQYILSEFVEGCERCLMGGCEVKLAKCDECKINANRDAILIALLIFLRDSIAKGAKYTAVSCVSSEVSAEISLSVFERYDDPKAVYDPDKTFPALEPKDIVPIIIEKMGGECNVTDDVLKITFPLIDGTVMESDSTEYGSSLFSLYRIMLSDLGNITLL